jgi:DNA-binding transcriptional LysR family regulator
MARTFDPTTLRLFVAVCEERNIARAAEREAIVASAVSKRIAFADAVGHVSVSVSPGGMMDRLLHREAARLGTSLVNRIQVSGLDAAARIVAAGLGPAILPREAVAMYAVSRGLAMVPLTDAWAQRQFVICHRADGGVSATTRLLVEALRAAATSQA